MTPLDIIILIPIAWFAYKGICRGVVYEACSLLGIALGIYLANLLAANVAEQLGIKGHLQLLAAFLLILVAVVILSRIAGRLAARALKLVELGAADKIAGAMLGILKAVALLSVIIYYIETIDHKHILLTAEAVEQSLLYHPVNAIGNLLLGSIKLFIQNHPLT